MFKREKLNVIFLRVTCFLCSALLVILAPVSTYAKLSPEKLEMFAQNNIMFYDPDEVEAGTACGATPNGVYKGVQYALTDDELRGFARMAKNENGCSIEAIRTELSQMANLYERNGGGEGIVKYITRKPGEPEHGWYATYKDFSDSSISVSDEQLQAARDVLVNGNRSLPPQVVEHDCIGDIRWIELDGKRHEATNPGKCNGQGLGDKSLYVSGKTKIHTVYQDANEYYVFYRFAGGENGCGDPFGYFESNPPSGSYSNAATGTNVNYAGVRIFSDAELQAIEANRPFYEKSANERGFPWQILAVLHRRERSLMRDNEPGGQGVYGLYSYTRAADGESLDPEKAFLPAGPISDEEFQRQTDIAADIVVSLSKGLDLGTDSGIKNFFYNYNGHGYYNQAISLGFSEAEANIGEGSPYVMNRFDKRRDPTVEPTKSNNTWGQIIHDNGGIEYPAVNEMGAFLMYSAIGGSSSYCSNGLVSGGMTLEEAGKVAQLYIDKQSETLSAKNNIDFDGVTLYYYDSCGSALTNCVAFSRWFLSKYTNVEKSKIPAVNGNQYVKAMINNGFEDGGNTPRAYAIFSTTESYGNHTGVVFGVDEANDTIIIGEAGCSGSGVANTAFTGAKKKKLSDYNSGNYVYAYTDSVLIGF